MSQIVCGCGRSYWPRQRWQHETCAINRTAINAEKAGHLRAALVERYGALEKSEKTANRRDRKVYNEYMRRKMREYRAAKKAAQKPS
jgi:hypothetical protein